MDEIYYDMTGTQGKRRRNIKNKLEKAEMLVKGIHHVFGKPPRVEPGRTQNQMAWWNWMHRDQELPSTRLEREYPREPSKPQQKKRRRKTRWADQVETADGVPVPPSSPWGMWATA